MWRISFNDVAEKALLKLDKPVRQRVLGFLRERVEPSDDPKTLAEILTGEFRGLWRFRVGDYRVVCDIQKAIQVVAVLDIRRRSEVYRKKRS